MAWERHGRGMGTACYVWIGLYGAAMAAMSHWSRMRST